MSENIFTYNPPPRKAYVYGPIGALIFLILGITLSAAKNWSLIPIIVSSIVAIIPLWYFYAWDFWDRPLMVGIENWGLVLHLRHRKIPRMIQWSNIIWLKAPPGDPEKLQGQYDRDGYILTSDNKRGYALYWPIAIAVREAYFEHVGKYPPTFKEWDTSHKHR